ncbi:hypothetical protein DEU29_11541 [Idiomarina aquatica]|uniref:Uncharacterized protein n=1 Tax=Idiomarina aquatica TaxID=1327752 RepID=A0A4R6NZI8_9GAMM|nr:hypothetical protein DEU29_11541 [Idiomarina aquatica]
MKKRNSEHVINYNLGITGTSTVVALFKSLTQSKALVTMFALGLIAVISFLSFLMNS